MSFDATITPVRLVVFVKPVVIAVALLLASFTSTGIIAAFGQNERSWPVVVIVALLASAIVGASVWTCLLNLLPRGRHRAAARTAPSRRPRLEP